MAASTTIPTATEIKKFAARDGAGLLIARSAGIKVMICTGRESEPVRRRAAELKLDYVYQNVRRKSDFLREFMAQNGYAKEEVAYCGDDINDLAAMNLCGFVACPADASDIIRGAGGFTSASQNGGHGAVRGAVQKILETDGRWKDAVFATFGVPLD